MSEITKERRFDTYMDTKIRLLQLGMKQIDLIKLLSEKGIDVNTTELSLAVNEKGNQEKHKKIRAAINEILSEREAACDMRN